MNLVRATVTVSGLTLLSRITGLIRENMTAVLFGASAYTDAFFVAFRLPNLLRRLFAEGAFSQAFVPLLAQARAEGEEGAVHQLVDQVATALFWALIGLCVVGVLAAPWLVWSMASGLARDAQAFAAATLMTRWMFPYILFISLVSLSAGILNTWRRFAVPAFSPVLLNLSFIGFGWTLSHRVDPPILALAIGVVVGGILQLGIQVPALLRIGMLPKISLDFIGALRQPRTRQLLGRMAPAVLSVSVAQISLVINTQIASRLAAGSVSWVSYADRLMEFPTAMLGVALGTVLLPSLSRSSALGERAQYSDLLDWGLRLVALLAVPCTLGLALAATPLVAVLFHYGHFSGHDVAMTAHAVACYGVGLLGLIAVKVLAPGFYAHQDVRTPTRIALLMLAATQALNLVLVPLLAHAGLALSISLAALGNAALLLSGLRRRDLYRPAPGWAAFGLRIMAASALMGAALWSTQSAIDWVASGLHPVLRAVWVAGLIAGAALIYFITLRVLGISVVALLRRRATPIDGPRTED